MPKYFPVGGERRVAAGSYTYLPPQDKSEKEFLRAGYEFKNALYKYYKGDADKADIAYFQGPPKVDAAIKKAEKEGKPEAWLNYVSSGKGDMTPKDYLATIKTGVKEKRTLPERLADVRTAITPEIEPTVAKQAGELAGADTIIDPKTGRAINVKPGTNVPVNVPLLARPYARIAETQNNSDAKNAFEKADNKIKRGNKIDADKYINLGMALLASGAKTLAGGSPFAMQNIGAGLGAGVGTFAELQKQDKAENIQQQRLLESERAHRASEANMQYRVFESGLRAAAKSMFPHFDEMTPDEQYVAAQKTRLRYLLSLPSEQQQALGVNPEFLRQQEAMLGSTSSAKKVPKYNPTTGKIEE
jgi:hypothetical protein